MTLHTSAWRVFDLYDGDSRQRKKLLGPRKTLVVVCDLVPRYSRSPRVSSFQWVTYEGECTTLCTPQRSLTQNAIIAGVGLSFKRFTGQMDD